MKHTAILLALLLSCSASKHTSFDFLIGTWKVAGKEQYEVWEKGENGALTGYAYQLEADGKDLSETLAIEPAGKRIRYVATVPSQNDGQPVPFILNPQVKDRYSFENDRHDFPKKIQYKPIAPDTLEVTVLGDNGEGFSYKQTRQPTE